MAVVALEIKAREPLADGIAFGEVGPYEQVEGTIHFAVDPAHPANAGIVDLGYASRGTDDRVAFQADFCVIQPTDASRGNGRLLFDVPNRGRKVAVRMFDRCPWTAAPSPTIDPGDGFLLRRGWTVAWCGWQWDVVPGPGLLTFAAPTAIDAQGVPIAGQVLCQFQPVDHDRDHLLADRVHVPYEAADIDDPEATLNVREWAGGPRTLVPRTQWRFARDEGGQPVPDPRRVWMAGGFTPGSVYEVIYRTRVCPVVGCGLLAVRDAAAFLGNASLADGNPCAGRITHTFGFGMSQSGRFLRHFLHLGLNIGEDGRQVFDGLHIHVAGARRGEFNHRYGQPSTSSIPSFGHLPPFHTAGLLELQRARGGVPRIVETNTSAEYWRGDGSLLHTNVPTDSNDASDVEPPPEARCYHFAGTQHVPGRLPPDFVGPDGARSANPANVVDYAPLLRAALDNLDRWVTASVEPPPSRFPRLSDGTAVPMATALATHRTLPGLVVPHDDRVPRMPVVAMGPDGGIGVGRYPADTEVTLRTFVAAVDDDGNELTGVRLPDLTVPVATHTGWNPRDPETGGVGQIISMQGSSHPFPATEADRARLGDPRPSLEARYSDLGAYLAQVRTAATVLVEQGYLLAEDVQITVADAADRFRAIIAR